MKDILASVHALLRANQRFGWDKETTLMVSKHAFDKGRDRLNKNGTITKVFGSKAFVFKGNLLLTIHETKLK